MERGCGASCSAGCPWPIGRHRENGRGGGGDAAAGDRETVSDLAAGPAGQQRPPCLRRSPAPCHLDLRRARRLGQRHGRDAGRSRGADLRRVERHLPAGPEGHRLVGLPRSPHRRVAGVRRLRSSPPACRSCVAASRGWPRSPTPHPGSRWPPASSSSSARARGPTAVAALAVFFFVFISTTVGLSAAPAAVHDVASVLGASRFQRMWLVQLPAAWPSIADGLKLAAPAALAGAIFGEWYGAPRGLGVLLITAMQSARPQQLWAASLLERDASGSSPSRSSPAAGSRWPRGSARRSPRAPTVRERRATGSP